jgi:hypothetical protein
MVNMLPQDQEIKQFDYGQREILNVFKRFENQKEMFMLYVGIQIVNTYVQDQEMENYIFGNLKVTLKAHIQAGAFIEYVDHPSTPTTMNLPLPSTLGP